MMFVGDDCVKSLLYLFTGLLLTYEVLAQESLTPKVVSQCFRQNGFSFVSLYCGWNKVIQIKVAYHGRHKNANIKHCGELQGDCTKDTTDQYDWSKCEGKHSCVQMIRSNDMSLECPKQSGVQYLQVEYLCLPYEESTEIQIEPTPPSVSDNPPLPGEEKTKKKKKRKKGKKKSENEVAKSEPVIEEPKDICVNFTSKVTSKITVESPGYPEYYMANTDCRCAIQAKTGSKVAVTYQDLALVQEGAKCVDWLLLQSPGHKDSTAVTCGQHGGAKTILSQANWLLMHFHTAQVDLNDVDGLKKMLNGFKVDIQSYPEAPFNIKCYSVHPDILKSLKKKTGSDDSSSLVLPASDIDAIAIAGALSGAHSIASDCLAKWTLLILLESLSFSIILRLAT